MIVIGLTGSIGMGKTTAGKMLERLGIPVHDADAAVHKAMSFPKGPALASIGDAFPYDQYQDIYGKKKFGRREINRKALGELVFNNDDERAKLEAILHPLVQESQQAFKRKCKNSGQDVVALDIPLLFETGADRRVDYVAVVSAPLHIQSKRVLARPNMSAEKFQSILNRQMPDGEKCARADYIIKSGLGMAYTMRQVKAMVMDIRKRYADSLALNDKDEIGNYG